LYVIEDQWKVDWYLLIAGVSPSENAREVLIAAGVTSRTLRPANGLASTYRCSINQRNMAPSTDRLCAAERADSPLANGCHSGDERGRGGPAQRVRGDGRRKNAR